MSLLKISNGTIEINEKILLENIDFEIHSGERMALIGENGVGKTTLMKAIVGEQKLTKGSIMKNVEKHDIGILQQDVSGIKDISVRECVERQKPSLFNLKIKLQQLLDEWEKSGDDHKVVTEYNHLLETYLNEEGYKWEEKVERCLIQMGIEAELWQKPFQTLSGGQKTRVGLAHVLMNDPTFLILDEPTNHIDLETVQWMTKWLTTFKGTVLFISHDRAFIDEVATATMEITAEGTKVYQGGYSSYKRQKNEEMKAERALYDKQEKEKKKLKEMIQVYKNWHQKAKSAASVRDPFAQKQAGKGADKYKAKEKILQRLEKESISKPKESAAISPSFHNEEYSPKRMLQLTNVCFEYEEKVIFRDVNVLVERGDRIAVIGKNGSGKTTLLKLASGLLFPVEGNIQSNPQLRIGYFMQELDNLVGHHTILDEIMTIQDMTQAEARTILASFLFRKEDVYKQVQHLSMGERCRVAFVKLYFSEANLLILDEPTNYLDIATREKIEEALEAYVGSIIVVSHDSYLLRRLCNKVLSVSNQRVETYLGSYKDWEKRSEEPLLSSENQQQQYLLELQLLSLLGVDENGLTEEEKLLRKKQIQEVELKMKDWYK